MTRGATALEGSLSAIAGASETAANGQVEATASMSGNVVHAEFANDNGRVLSVELTIRDNGRYRVDAWKVVAIQNEEQPAGDLLVLG